MTDIPYLVRLREDLVTGIARRQQRVVARRRRMALVLTPAAVAGAVLATTLPGGSSPALAIAKEGDWIEVQIADAAASEAQMESELRAAGIDADISLTPTTAEHVGRWTCINVATSAFTDPSRQPDDEPQLPDVRSHLRVTPEVLSVQRGFADRLVLVVGRAPEAGEQPSAHPEVCGDARLVS
jgi:hypothetical protein